MSRRASTGVLALIYAPVLANPGSPTIAELTAGVDLSPWLTRDGLDTPQEGSTIDVAGVASRYNATQSGSYGGQPVTVSFFRDDVPEEDVAWDTLPRGTAGYLVIARFGFSGAGDPPVPVAADVVESWEIDVISRAMMAIADNEAQKFVVSCSVPSEPVDDGAVVAA